MRRAEFVKGEASQRLYFNTADCDEVTGQVRPTSTPSVQIKDSSGATLKTLATTAVTQNTVDTTLTASVSQGDLTATAASATALEARKTYRVEGIAGNVEWMRLKSFNSTALTFGEAFGYDHTVLSGASYGTLTSTDFYVTLASGDVDALGELFVAVASYTDGTLSYELRVPFDVVLHPLPNPLTRERVAAEHPDIFRQEYAETYGEDFAQQRELAWDRVHDGIRKAHPGMRPAMVITVEDLYEWGMAELRYALQRDGVSIIRGRDLDPRDAFELLRADLSEKRSAALASIKWADMDESETLDEGEASPQTMAFMR